MPSVPPPANTSPSFPPSAHIPTTNPNCAPIVSPLTDATRGSPPSSSSASASCQTGEQASSLASPNPNVPTISLPTQSSNMPTSPVDIDIVSTVSGRSYGLPTDFDHPLCQPRIDKNGQARPSQYLSHRCPLCFGSTHVLLSTEE
jgi:hypothetical protein